MAEQKELSGWRSSEITHSDNSSRRVILSLILIYRVRISTYRPYILIHSILLSQCKRNRIGIPLIWYAVYFLEKVEKGRKNDCLTLFRAVDFSIFPFIYCTRYILFSILICQLYFIFESWCDIISFKCYDMHESHRWTKQQNSFVNTTT